MPRAKRVTVAATHGETTDDRVTALAQHVFFINKHSPLTATSPVMAMVLEVLFTMISRGPVGPVYDTCRALMNLAALVDAGGHLRRCTRCKLWFVTKDARQRLCKWPQCKVQRTRERVAASQALENDRRRRARSDSVKRT